jgi:hypothetical protein
MLRDRFACTRRLPTSFRQSLVAASLAAGLSTLLAIQTLAAQTIRNTLIVPGQRIGPLYLGMSDAELLAAVGPPDQTVNWDKSAVSYIYENPKLWVVVVKKTRRVGMINTSSSMFRTAEGIGVGSTQLELDVKMPKRKRGRGGVACYGNTKTEIWFSDASDGRITQIFMFSNIDSPNCRW